jgi:hypothetical protein
LSLGSLPLEFFFARSVRWPKSFCLPHPVDQIPQLRIVVGEQGFGIDQILLDAAQAGSDCGEKSLQTPSLIGGHGASPSSRTGSKDSSSWSLSSISEASRQILLAARIACAARHRTAGVTSLESSERNVSTASWGQPSQPIGNAGDKFGPFACDMRRELGRLKAPAHGALR